MIVMIISDSPAAERKKILHSARDQAARYTDEYWQYIESGSISEMEDSIRSVDKIDMACIDLTLDDGIRMAEKMRQEHRDVHMILIADEGISPVKYIRPSIQAESLMLKPLKQPQLSEVLGEAIENYIRRFAAPDEKKVFLVENGGEKNLISHDRILFFEAREKKVFLSTEREEYGFYDTLDELEDRLGEGFMRCHRSYIVNTARISRVEISGSRVILDDETEIPLSRSYKPAMKDFIKGRKKDGSNR